MRISYVSIFFAIATLTITGCAPREGGPGSRDSSSAGDQSATLAQVGDRRITEDVFAVYAQNRVNRPSSEISDDEKEQLLNDAINLYALANEARAQGIDDEPQIRGQIELQSLGILAQTLVQRHMATNAVSDDEVEAEFASQAAAAPSLEYKARHILLEDEETAKAVIEKLDAGEEFSELAKSSSTGPSGPNGGDLGWFTSNQMVEPFANAVAAMEPGAYTKEPVQTQFGWHVILTEDRREVPSPNLDDMRDRIVPVLQQNKVQKFVDQIRANTTIELGEK